MPPRRRTKAPADTDGARRATNLGRRGHRVLVAPRAGGRPARPRAARPEDQADVALERSTRDRILDVALDLFLEKGFDKTSLREIAEHLGFTKAALYYHFSSKDDIFMALHLRLHELAREGASKFAAGAVTPESWARLLDWFIDQIPANRKLIAMHERNRTSFEVLHRHDHDVEHQDLEDQLRAALSDQSLPARERVRMVCAFSAVMGVALGSEAFSGLRSDQLVTELKAAVHDLLGCERRAGGAALS